jgi:hypothetical protein
LTCTHHADADLHLGEHRHVGKMNQSGRISGGSARLTLRDASGTDRYTRALTETGTFTSASNTTGNWRIEVQLDNVTGTLNFRVQKP